MNGDAGLLLPLIKISGALVLVVALLLLALRALRRWSGPGVGGDGPAAIRLLATRPLGPKKFISLVRVPGALLVLGVSADQIRSLAQIDDPDVLAEIDRTPPAGNARFGDHLARLTRRGTD